MSSERQDRIDALLDEAYQSKDWEETRRLALKVLELDSNQVEALVLLADASEDEVEQIALLRRALSLLPSIGEGGRKKMTQEERELRATVLERLGVALLLVDPEEVLGHAAESVRVDPVECEIGRSLTYAALLLLHRGGDVLQEYLQDQSEFPARFYGRALALYQMVGKGEAFFVALWEALAKESDIAFYALGLWPDPSPDKEDEWEYVRLSSILITPWWHYEEAYAWLLTATVLFGYLTDRIPDEIFDELRPDLAESGFLDKMNQCLGEFDALLRPMGELSAEAIDDLALDYLSKRRFSEPLWI